MLTIQSSKQLAQGDWVQPTGTVAAMDLKSRPRVLIAASTWWPSSARLATAIARTGCEVFAVCPQGHPLRCLSSVRRVYGIRGIRSRSSLHAAICRAKPDYIVPCDDRIVTQLHELFSLHPELRPLIEYSLGSAAGFDTADSRAAFHRTALELDILVPRSAVVTTPDEARHIFTQFGAVAVVKLDGTHGGEGVRIVRSADEAAAAVRSLRLSAGLLSALHRLLIHGDQLALWSWTRRAQAEISIQEYIPGTPANSMVACWRGEVLAEISVEAVSCQGLTGSANVVRRIDSADMSRGGKLVAARLGISGFFWTRLHHRRADREALPD